MRKIAVILVVFLSTCQLIFAEEVDNRIYTEDYLKELISDQEKSDEQLRLDYIEAAEIKQLTGELKSAAELFKKASFAVKGQKDFESLYRASVLNVEMAFYRIAEADLRAILTFSDDVTLRIKSMVLSARIKQNTGKDDDARSIIENIFESTAKVPELVYEFARTIFSQEELFELSGSHYSDFVSDEVLSVKHLLNPETVFGKFTVESATTSPPMNPVETDDEDTENTAVGIQLGSFSVKENAVELGKSVDKLGFQTIIRSKFINDKQYYSVLVPVIEGRPVQQMIIKLKESGFEGYPVY